jgi:hypothetical protein
MRNVSILAWPEGQALQNPYRTYRLESEVSILAWPEGQALPFAFLSLNLSWVERRFARFNS